MNTPVIQLFANNSQNELLTVNPEMTFFKKTYIQPDVFIKDEMVLKDISMKWDDTYYMKIPKDIHLLGSIWATIKIPYFQIIENIKKTQTTSINNTQLNEIIYDNHTTFLIIYENIYYLIPIIFLQYPDLHFNYFKLRFDEIKDNFLLTTQISIPDNELIILFSFNINNYYSHDIIPLLLNQSKSYEKIILDRLLNGKDRYKQNLLTQNSYDRYITKKIEDELINEYQNINKFDSMIDSNYYNIVGDEVAVLYNNINDTNSDLYKTNIYIDELGNNIINSPEEIKKDTITKTSLIYEYFLNNINPSIEKTYTFYKNYTVINVPSIYELILKTNNIIDYSLLGGNLIQQYYPNYKIDISTLNIPFELSTDMIFTTINNLSVIYEKNEVSPGIFEYFIKINDSLTTTDLNEINITVNTNNNTLNDINMDVKNLVSNSNAEWTKNLLIYLDKLEYNKELEVYLFDEFIKNYYLKENIIKSKYITLELSDTDIKNIWIELKVIEDKYNQVNTDIGFDFDINEFNNNISNIQNIFNYILDIKQFPQDMGNIYSIINNKFYFNTFKKYFNNSTFLKFYYNKINTFMYQRYINIKNELNITEFNGLILYNNIDLRYYITKDLIQNYLLELFNLTSFIGYNSKPLLPLIMKTNTSVDYLDELNNNIDTSQYFHELKFINNYKYKNTSNIEFKYIQTDVDIFAIRKDLTNYLFYRTNLVNFELYIVINNVEVLLDIINYTIDSEYINLTFKRPININNSDIFVSTNDLRMVETIKQSIPVLNFGNNELQTITFIGKDLNATPPINLFASNNTFTNPSILPTLNPNLIVRIDYEYVVPANNITFFCRYIQNTLIPYESIPAGPLVLPSIVDISLIKATVTGTFSEINDFKTIIVYDKKLGINQFKTYNSLNINTGTENSIIIMKYTIRDISISYKTTISNGILDNLDIPFDYTVYDRVEMILVNIPYILLPISFNDGDIIRPFSESYPYVEIDKSSITYIAFSSQFTPYNTFYINIFNTTEYVPAIIIEETSSVVYLYIYSSIVPNLQGIDELTLQIFKNDFLPNLYNYTSLNSNISQVNDYMYQKPMCIYLPNSSEYIYIFANIPKMVPIVENRYLSEEQRLDIYLDNDKIINIYNLNSNQLIRNKHLVELYSMYFDNILLSDSKYIDTIKNEIIDEYNIVANNKLVDIFESGQKEYINIYTEILEYIESSKFGKTTKNIADNSSELNLFKLTSNQSDYRISLYDTNLIDFDTYTIFSSGLYTFTNINKQNINNDKQTINYLVRRYNDIVKNIVNSPWHQYKPYLKINPNVISYLTRYASYANNIINNIELNKSALVVVNPNNFSQDYTYQYIIKDKYNKMICNTPKYDITLGHDTTWRKLFPFTSDIATTYLTAKIGDTQVFSSNETLNISTSKLKLYANDTLPEYTYKSLYDKTNVDMDNTYKLVGAISFINNKVQIKVDIPEWILLDNFMVLNTTPFFNTLLQVGDLNYYGINYNCRRIEVESEEFMQFIKSPKNIYIHQFSCDNMNIFNIGSNYIVRIDDNLGYIKNINNEYMVLMIPINIILYESKIFEYNITTETESNIFNIIIENKDYVFYDRFIITNMKVLLYNKYNYYKELNGTPWQYPKFFYKSQFDSLFSYRPYSDYYIDLDKIFIFSSSEFIRLYIVSDDMTILPPILIEKPKSLSFYNVLENVNMIENKNYWININNTDFQLKDIENIIIPDGNYLIYYKNSTIKPTIYKHPDIFNIEELVDFLRIKYNPFSKAITFDFPLNIDTTYGIEGSNLIGKEIIERIDNNIVYLYPENESFKTIFVITEDNTDYFNRPLMITNKKSNLEYIIYNSISQPHDSLLVIPYSTYTSATSNIYFGYFEFIFTGSAIDAPIINTTSSLIKLEQTSASFWDINIVYNQNITHSIFYPIEIYDKYNQKIILWLYLDNINIYPDIVLNKTTVDLPNIQSIVYEPLHIDVDYTFQFMDHLGASTNFTFNTIDEKYFYDLDGFNIQNNLLEHTEIITLVSDRNLNYNEIIDAIETRNFNVSSINDKNILSSLNEWSYLTFVDIIKNNFIDNIKLQKFTYFIFKTADNKLYFNEKLSNTNNGIQLYYDINLSNIEVFVYPYMPIFIICDLTYNTNNTKAYIYTDINMLQRNEIIRIGNDIIQVIAWSKYYKCYLGDIILSGSYVSMTQGYYSFGVFTNYLTKNTLIKNTQTNNNLIFTSAIKYYFEYKDGDYIIDNNVLKRAVFDTINFNRFFTLGHGCYIKLISSNYEYYYDDTMVQLKPYDVVIFQEGTVDRASFVIDSLNGNKITFKSAVPEDLAYKEQNVYIPLQPFEVIETIIENNTMNNNITGWIEIYLSGYINIFKTTNGIIDGIISDGTYTLRIISIDKMNINHDFNNYFSVDINSIDQLNNIYYNGNLENKNNLPLKIKCTLHKDEEYVYFTNNINFDFSIIKYCYYMKVLIDNIWYPVISMKYVGPDTNDIYDTNSSFAINVLSSMTDLEEGLYDVVFSATNINKINLVSNKHIIRNSNKLDYPSILNIQQFNNYLLSEDGLTDRATLITTVSNSKINTSNLFIGSTDINLGIGEFYLDDSYKLSYYNNQVISADYIYKTITGININIKYDGLYYFEPTIQLLPLDILIYSDNTNPPVILIIDQVIDTRIIFKNLFFSPPLGFFTVYKPNQPFELKTVNITQNLPDVDIDINTNGYVLIYYYDSILTTDIYKAFRIYNGKVINGSNIPSSTYTARLLDFSLFNITNNFNNFNTLQIPGDRITNIDIGIKLQGRFQATTIDGIFQGYFENPSLNFYDFTQIKYYYHQPILVNNISVNIVKIEKDRIYIDAIELEQIYPFTVATTYDIIISQFIDEITNNKDNHKSFISNDIQPSSNDIISSDQLFQLLQFFKNNNTYFNKSYYYENYIPLSINYEEKKYTQQFLNIISQDKVLLQEITADNIIYQHYININVSNNYLITIINSNNFINIETSFFFLHNIIPCIITKYNNIILLKPNYQLYRPVNTLDRIKMDITIYFRVFMSDTPVRINKKWKYKIQIATGYLGNQTFNVLKDKQLYVNDMVPCNIILEDNMYYLLMDIYQLSFKNFYFYDVAYVDSITNVDKKVKDEYINMENEILNQIVDDTNIYNIDLINRLYLSKDNNNNILELYDNLNSIVNYGSLEKNSSIGNSNIIEFSSINIDNKYFINTKYNILDTDNTIQLYNINIPFQINQPLYYIQDNELSTSVPALERFIYYEIDNMMSIISEYKPWYDWTLITTRFNNNLINYLENYDITYNGTTFGTIVSTSYFTKNEIERLKDFMKYIYNTQEALEIMNELYLVELYLLDQYANYITQILFWNNINEITLKILKNFNGNYNWTITNNIITIEDEFILYPNNFILIDGIYKRVNYLEREFDMSIINNIITIGRNPSIIDTNIGYIINNINNINLYGTRMDNIIRTLYSYSDIINNITTKSAIQSTQYMDSIKYYIFKLYNILSNNPDTNLNKLTKLDRIVEFENNKNYYGKYYDFYFNERYFGINGFNQYYELNLSNDTIYVNSNIILDLYDKQKDVNTIETNNIFNYTINISDNENIIKNINEYTVDIQDNINHLIDPIIENVYVSGNNLSFESDKMVEPTKTSIIAKEPYDIIDFIDYGPLFEIITIEPIDIYNEIYYGDIKILLMSKLNRGVDNNYVITISNNIIFEANLPYITTYLKVVIKSIKYIDDSTYITFSNNYKAEFNYIKINETVYEIIDGIYIDEIVQIKTNELYDVLKNIKYTYLNFFIIPDTPPQFVRDITLERDINPLEYIQKDITLPNVFSIDFIKINQLKLLLNNKIRIVYEYIDSIFTSLFNFLSKEKQFGTILYHTYRLNESIPYDIIKIIPIDKYYYKIINKWDITTSDSIMIDILSVSIESIKDNIIMFSIDEYKLIDELNNSIIYITKYYNLNIISYNGILICSIPDNFTNISATYNIIDINNNIYDVNVVINNYMIIYTDNIILNLTNLRLIQNIISLDHNIYNELNNQLYSIEIYIEAIYENKSEYFIPTIQILKYNDTIDTLDNLTEIDAKYYYKIITDDIPNFKFNEYIYIIDNSLFIKALVIIKSNNYVMVGTNTYIEPKIITIYSNDFTDIEVINLLNDNYPYYEGELLKINSGTEFEILLPSNSISIFNPTGEDITEYKQILIFKYSEVKLFNKSYPNIGFNKVPDIITTNIINETLYEDVKWIDNMPINLFKTIEFIMDNNIIEKLDSDTYTIYGTYILNLFKREDFIRQAQLRKLPDGSIYFNLVIPFYSTHTASHYLPISSMKQNNFKIRFLLNKLASLILNNKEGYTVNANPIVDLNYSFMTVDSSILNKFKKTNILLSPFYSYQSFILNKLDEYNHISLLNRTRELFFITKTKNNTIKKIQTTEYDSWYSEYLENKSSNLIYYDIIDGEIEMKSNRYLLLSTHPIISKYDVRFSMFLDSKYLNYIDENLNDSSIKYSYKLTVLSLYFTNNYINQTIETDVNIIDKLNIMINGKELLPELPSEYHNLVIPYMKGYFLPPGYHMYGFSYDSLDKQPNGMINMRKIKDFLIYSKQQDINEEYRLKVCTREYKILSIDNMKGSIL